MKPSAPHTPPDPGRTRPVPVPPDPPGVSGELEKDAAELHRVLTELLQVYQSRNRKRICCEDISVTQCFTLAALVDLGSPTLQKLAGQMYLDKSTTSRVVGSLVRKGLARRVREMGDARIIRVECTDEGRRLYQKIRERLIEEEKLLVADFDPQVRRATAELIARLACAAKKRLSREEGACHAIDGSSSCGIAIRNCGPPDLNAVRRLLAQADLCLDGVEDQYETACAVAEAGGRIAGCAGLEIHGPYGLLRSVAVAPRTRGNGIGRMLVENRLEHAKARGLEAIYLLTVTAQTYFERFGFEPIGRDEAPLEIRRTVEFSEACPKTAAVMKLGIRKDTRAHEEGNDMDIKKEVRERYADAARRVRGQSEKAESPNAGSCCCGDRTSAEKAITENLYDDAQLKDVPLEAALASLGCGNPTALAELKPGDVVLDLGSGGGIDVILTAKRVGPSGKAYGLDMTDEMLDVARENQRKAGVENVEFLKGEIEAIPLPAGSVDVVISNCVINLSPDKPQVLREAFRVLKPGGRLAVSDIISRGPIPDDVRRDMELWTGCIAGALEEKQYRTYLEDAGFERIDIEPTRVFRLEQGCCSGKKIQIEESPSVTPAEGTFMSAFIRAAKPGGKA